jgi:hypothetical protein
MVLDADVQFLRGLSAEQVIDKNIAALGGLRAWRSAEPSDEG